ncbi:MAG TPA: hypothetical protein VMF90_22505 [Rhizobiaceae bacterium]|nr:hypothetical protein [Rhizobiaceae bacterium]
MKLVSRLAWLCCGAMLAIYALMVLVTLPRIATEAGGLLPFDLRPLGYTHAEAVAFLSALTPAGKDIYLTIQHRLDFVFPAVFALTIAFAIVLLTPSRWGGLRWIAAAVIVIPGAIFDYLENAAVARLLKAAPEALTPELARAAHIWTLLKSAATTIAMVLVLLLLIGWFYRRIAGRPY